MSSIQSSQSINQYWSSNNIIDENPINEMAALKAERDHLKQQLNQCANRIEEMKGPYFKAEFKEIKRQINIMCGRIRAIPSTPESEQIRKKEGDVTGPLMFLSTTASIIIWTVGFALTSGFGGFVATAALAATTQVAPPLMAGISNERTYPLDHRNPRREKEFREFTARYIEHYLKVNPHQYKNALWHAINEYLKSDIKDKVPNTLLMLAEPESFSLLKKD